MSTTAWEAADAPPRSETPPSSRPLQNRCDPFGALHAVPARGTLMGNRGGRFHGADQRIGARTHVSRRWITCECVFRGRRRAVWGDSYTEIFFLDEVTALAAGHRPCFECRRADALAFAAAFSDGDSPAAGDMDAILDRERRDGRIKRTHPTPINELPDGAVIAWKGETYAAWGGALRQWSFGGYGPPFEQPRGIAANVLTPPSVMRALRRGYAPRWHESINEN